MWHGERPLPSPEGIVACLEMGVGLFYVPIATKEQKDAEWGSAGAAQTPPHLNLPCRHRREVAGMRKQLWNSPLLQGGAAAEPQKPPPGKFSNLSHRPGTQAVLLQTFSSNEQTD